MVKEARTVEVTAAAPTFQPFGQPRRATGVWGSHSTNEDAMLVSGYVKSNWAAARRSKGHGHVTLRALSASLPRDRVDRNQLDVHVPEQPEHPVEALLI